MLHCAFSVEMETSKEQTLRENKLRLKEVDKSGHLFVYDSNVDEDGKWSMLKSFEFTSDRVSKSNAFHQVVAFLRTQQQGVVETSLDELNKGGFKALRKRLGSLNGVAMLGDICVSHINNYSNSHSNQAREIRAQKQ